ncbi:unnamed protein product [Trichogramma brassicae]|uniref:Protein MON2 homolog n=1 Tax=Trichogramma brassicae TaxID=86971 RepID=A0A6H5I914_9HYME|nr:unnamed protein product [Trichogramma brassicae]
MSNATPGLAAVAAGPAGVQDNSAKLFESLQADLKVLATETKKKFPQIKEACEESIIKLRQASSINQSGQVYYVVNQILYPLVQGCESKDVKISKLCLNVMQRLITQQAIDQKGARFITDALKTLMEAGIEEVKVLQTVTLLLTSNSLVQGDNLARNLVLCFRLHFTKDSTTCNTAGATVRQLVSLVFERVVAEDEQYSDQPTIDENLEELKIPTSTPPKGLRPCAADAFLMFQDLVQLVNADQPYWLTGIVEMTRTFGLELLESVLTNFSSVFFKHPEFSFLLKERVCALVIKLFSPNIKYRNSVPASVQQATPLDKPYFPISMRLLRVVSILIQKYHFLLVTECEIFLSLIVKFLDPDKPPWQRALALEVLHKMTVQANLLTSFCNCYDLKPHATNIFQDIVNSLGAYIHSLFVNPNMVPSNTGAQQGPVMLTVKNLQCMRALLLLAHCHGSILGSAWHLVLTTLQHLAWILGLKPSTGGSLKAGRTAADSNAMLTTAVMADLPVLSAMLSRLFESSQHLDDVALHHLIDALCKLSQEAMELAYTNREPSLFAVAKLLETGLVNLPRVEVLWRPLTNHLLEVCQHPHIRMREWGVEAITYLVKAALQHKYAQPLRENQKLQTLLLGPLSELSSVRHADVRQRQLECVLQILHGAGETLFHGWPLVLGIIGAVSDHHGEALVRIAFQCLQLVITDFLPAMPWRCLPLCVDTAAKFGSQTQELNISLTAVGQMWNISDYFYHNHEKICASLSGDSASVFPDFPGTTNMSAFDKLWMCLFARLGDLCVDERPAVRKSASQTLFSTISAHGSLLQQPTWQAVLWQVLFPLLDKVRSLSSSASNEKVDTSGNILIHHSRNTAQKQWAETQVLTLSGVSRVFNTKRQLLQLLGDFPRAWSLLLEFVENSALSKNNEVSLAALKSFQEILYVPKSNADINNTDPTQSEDSEALWTIAWRIWLSIGLDSTKPPQENEVEPYIPSQAFLTALVQIFPTVFQHFKNKFTSADLQKLCLVLKYAVAVPVHGESTPYILPTVPDVVLTQLQDGVLHSMELIQKEALSSQENLKFMISPVFLQLLYYSKLACEAPSYGKIPTKHISQVRGVSADWVTMNYVPFGEKALSMVVNLYQKTANEPPVIEAQILKHIIEALHVPLGMKYACPSHTTWKLAVTSLLAILHIGLPLARNHPDSFQSMWQELADTLEHFLFPTNPVNLDRGIEEIQADEAVDCQVMELLRDEVLPHSQNIPQQFVLRVVMLLNKGSIHSATSNIEKSGEPKLREEFAKTCFETLLQFSLLDGLNGDSENINSEAITSAQRDEGGVAGRLAVTALLHRFQEVLKRYVEDERRSGKCPLPRYRLSEISFVLKAVATLVVSLKKAPANKVERSVWEQLIALYPCLVECTVTTSSGAVSRSLREALMQYHDLLHPPGCCTVTNSTNTSSTNSINNNDAPAANGV